MTVTARRVRVLVVEDDRDVRETVIEALEDQGYEADGAGDGAAALDVLRSGTELPTLILLDLMMPGMNGQQFREAQLADGTLDAIPVVLLSADASIEQKAATMQAAGFLRKPVRLAALLECAARFTGE